MSFAPLNEQMDVIRRGTVDLLPEDELVKKLETSIKTNEPLIIKQGFDSLGISVDWRRRFSTIDPHFNRFIESLDLLLYFVEVVGGQFEILFRGVRVVKTAATYSHIDRGRMSQLRVSCRGPSCDPDPVICRHLIINPQLLAVCQVLGRD